MKKTIITLAAIIGLAISSAAMADMSDPLFRVQSEVNMTLKFQSEGEGRDNWRMPTYRADCEDYALLKRSILISKYGFSPDDIQLLIVAKKVGSKTGNKNGVPTYAGHVVLHVKSLNMVLDNPSEEDPRQNIQPKPYGKFLEDSGYRLWCIVGDISEGDKDTNKRCIRNNK